jgi:hypothetical protein
MHATLGTDEADNSSEERDQPTSVEYVRAEWAGDEPEWNLNPPLKPGTVRIASIDDRSDYKPPCDPNEVPGLLPRYLVHVNGFYDLSTQLMYSMLMEVGSGSKDADSVIDETFINLIASCGEDRPQVIYLIHDCGGLELNQFQVHFAQFLVDHGFCLFAVQAYHEQLHGKFKCDFKFGHFTIAWNNEATLCLDDLLYIIGTLPQTSRGGDGNVRQTPAHAKDRGCALRSEAGTVYRDHFLGRFVAVTRLGQRGDNIHLIVLGHRLDLLSKERFTVERVNHLGVMVSRTTSLFEEMSLIASGKQGVGRFWTYPPSPSSFEVSEVQATLAAGNLADGMPGPARTPHE